MSKWIEAEFEAMFREHYGRIVRVVRRVLNSDAEAEEVCAEVFLRLYQADPSVAATGQIGGWLYRTATRAAIDALRANQRRGLQMELNASHIEPAEDAVNSPLNDLLARERIASVREVLALLNVEKAQMLLLRQSGLSYRELAAALQINAASVGTMLARAEAEFSMLYKRRQPEQYATSDRNTHQLKIVREER